MKKEFLFNQSGKLVGILVRTDKNYQLFDSERKINHEEYKKLLSEFDTINEINSYNTFSFFDEGNNNRVCNTFILYSGNTNQI